MTVRHLTTMTVAQWREVTHDAIAVVTIGSQEQHGGHLPVGTDTILAEAVVEGALSNVCDDTTWLRLPTLSYGASGHHLFAGAVTVDAVVLLDHLGQLLDSLAASGMRRVFVINGHGGNDEAVRLAVKRLALQRDVAAGCCNYWAVAAVDENDRAVVDEHDRAAIDDRRIPGHAGWFETALMLAVAPDLVGPVDWSPPEEPPLFDRPPHAGTSVERHGEWERVGGVSDDASLADMEVGRTLLNGRVRAVAAALDAFAAATAASHGPEEAGRNGSIEGSGWSRQEEQE